MADEERMMRLQRFLARAGVASRRAAEGSISEGRVAVNGHVVTEPGMKVDPACDEVRFDGEAVKIAPERVVLMLHKPAGYLTAMSDDRGRACVSSLVPTDRYPGLFPVGRLDFDTTGLLLFTTDGELGNALLHPSRHVDKVYEALVEGRPGRSALAHLRRGVVLDDGPCSPARVRIVGAQGSNVLVELAIHEGRKRQVKRMCAAVGHPVIRLHRSAFGPLTLGNLPCGSYRALSDEEVSALFRSVGGA